MNIIDTIKQALSPIKEICIDYGIFRPWYQQSLIKRPLSRKLITLYNGDDGHNINDTQYFLGFGLIHYALIRNTKPARILCVGSRKGYIPAILALACRDNGLGHVDFVDASYDKNEAKKHWSGVGFWKKIVPSEHFSKIRIEKCITTYVMTTQKFSDTFPDRRYQYIYIDGDHSYTGVRRDYDLFWPRLHKGGFMTFHDVVARGYLDKGLFGVWKFWKELRNMHTIILPFPKDSGLGILQK